VCYICRKRPKLFVPDESKDGRYWEKRGKNNVAARRSREARRLKENQIALRYHQSPHIGTIKCGVELPIRSMLTRSGSGNQMRPGGYKEMSSILADQ
jgi:hypothetical protein